MTYTNSLTKAALDGTLLSSGAQMETLPSNSGSKKRRKAAVKLFATLAFALLASGSSLFGDPIFSVQSGDLTITSQNTGTAGTKADPWTLGETLRGPGVVALVDSDDVPLGTLSPFTSGAWITKTVLNDSGSTWTSFELELQELLGIPSPDGDGLSFAQGNSLTFSSDKFTAITRIDTTRDYLNFSNGSVLNGESVTFKIAVTDNSPQSPVFLSQTPNKIDGSDLVNAAPEPAGILPLFGIALIVGLFFQRKRVTQK